MPETAIDNSIDEEICTYLRHRLGQAPIMMALVGIIVNKIHKKNLHLQKSVLSEAVFARIKKMTEDGVLVIKRKRLSQSKPHYVRTIRLHACHE